MLLIEQVSRNKPRCRRAALSPSIRNRKHPPCSGQHVSNMLAGGIKTRRYYIAANTIVWDYAPKGINACQGRNFSDSESLYTRNGAHAQYIKAQFQAFSDASFTKQLVRISLM